MFILFLRVDGKNTAGTSQAGELSRASIFARVKPVVPVSLLIGHLYLRIAGVEGRKIRRVYNEIRTPSLS